MNRERLLYWILGVSILLYVVVDYYSPKEIDWSITLDENDKRPFGTYILNEQLNQFFNNVTQDDRTFTQLSEDTGNIFSLAMQFQLGEEDREKVLMRVEDGGTVLLAAENLDKKFLESLNIEMGQYLTVSNQMSEDSLSVIFGDNQLFYPKNLISSYFKSPYDWKTLATVSGNPVFISKKIGKGYLYLSSTPLVFTNYGLLINENYSYVSFIFNQVNQEDILYNLFYQLGRREHRSPFRYLISQDSLRIAVYLTLFLILLLLIFNSQRKHKSVPVYYRPENSTLHFIKTIGGLHKKEGDHKAAAMKLVYHILFVLEERYFIHNTLNENTWEKISFKTGQTIGDIRDFMQTVKKIRSSEEISEVELRAFYKKSKKLNLI